MLRYGICGFEVIDPQPSCRLKESAKMANEASRSAQPSCGCAGGRTSLTLGGGLILLLLLLFPITCSSNQPWREEYKYTVKNLQLDLFPRLGQQSAEIVTYLKLSTFKRLSHQVWQS